MSAVASSSLHPGACSAASAASRRSISPSKTASSVGILRAGWRARHTPRRPLIERGARRLRACAQVPASALAKLPLIVPAPAHEFGGPPWGDKVNETYRLASAGGVPINPRLLFGRCRRTATVTKPVAIIMGSQSDWPTMRHAAETLDALGVGYDKRIVSAHRTPERLYAFAKGAKADGLQGDHRGRRRRRAPARHDRRDDDAAGVRRAGRVQGDVRRRFALFHRADAARRAGRHARDRQGRRDQCGAARRERAGARPTQRSRNRLEAWRKQQTDAVAEAPEGD